jgi:hypothetical protein
LGQEILLGAVEKIKGVGLQGAVGLELEIGLGVGEGSGGVVLTGVNPGEKDVSIGFAGVECECLMGAALGIGNAAERVLDESETIFCDAGRGRQLENFANEGFGLGEFGALIENHGESQERRSKVAACEVDGFLEVFGGGVKLADAVMRQTHVVEGSIGERSEIGGGLEVGKAGLGVTLEEKGRALFKSARGFARQRKIVDGHDGVVARSDGLPWGRRLR